MFEGFGEPVRNFVDSPWPGFTLAVAGIVTTILTAQISETAGVIAGALLFLAVMALVVWGLYVRVRFGGVYLAHDHVNEWDIETPERAKHIKTLDVEFIQDDVSSVYDYVWGDGEERLKDYNCSPYFKVDDFKAPGGPQNVLISFREKMARKSRLTLNISRTIVNGFPAEREWAEVGAYEITRKVTLRVKFPQGRPPQTWKLVRERGTREKKLDPVELKDTAGDRKMLEYTKKRPKRGDKFRFDWTW